MNSVAGKGVSATGPTPHAPQRRPVHVKVGFLATVLTLMLVAVSVVGAISVRSMQSDLDGLLEREGRVLTELTTVSQLTLQAQLGLERSADQDLDTRLDAVPALEAEVRNTLAYWQGVASGPDAPDIRGLTEVMENWLAAAAVVLDGLDETEPPDVQTLRDEFAPLQAALREVIEPLNAEVTTNAEDATDQADVAFRALLIVAVVGFVVGAIASRATYRATKAQHLEIDRRHQEQEIEASTAQSKARISQALEFAGNESDALDAAARALGELAPDRPTDLMLADSSRAHFEIGLRSGGDGSHACPVSSPRACPAVAKGQTLVFPDSERFESCAYMRGRPVGPISAVCVPVSIAGSAEGVLHSVGAQGDTVDSACRTTLEYVAARTGDRLGSLRAFDRSETQAATDPLTGLANRRSFEDHVGALMNAGARVTVAFGDIDHFKLLNDTHGHAAGDRALRAFAQVVRRTIRPDDFAARWGGEEFVIAFPGSTKNDAAAALERLRTNVMELGSDGRVPPFTISFGVADEGDGDDLEGMVAAADRALLAAKRTGRDRVLLASAATDALAAEAAAPDSPVEPVGRMSAN